MEAFEFQGRSALSFVPMVLALAVCCGAEGDRRVREPVARLDAHLAGTTENPVVIVRLNNQGKVPFKVDRELVFLVTVWCADANNVTIPEREARAAPRPDGAALRARFVDLRPGQSLERRIDLRGGFKCFGVGKGSFRPEEKKAPIISAYEATYRLEANPPLAAVTVRYEGVGLQYEGLLSYLGGTPVPGLYRGCLLAVVKRGK